MKIKNFTKKERAEHILKQYSSLLSEYNPDMLYDLGEIIPIRYNRFKSRLSSSEIDEIENILSEINEYKIKLHRHARFYIFCGIAHLLCAVNKLSQKNIQEVSDYLRISSMGTPKKISSVPDLASTAYIFIDDKLEYMYDIYPKECVALIRYFEDRNVLTNKLL